MVCLVFAAIAAVIGFGLWKLQNWARIVTIVFSGLGIVSGLLGFLTMLLHFSLVGLLFRMIGLGINGLILWYMLQPHVKQAFGAT